MILNFIHIARPASSRLKNMVSVLRPQQLST